MTYPRAATALFAALVCICLLTEPAGADDLRIEAEFGFRGYALERSWMPARVRIRASATELQAPAEATLDVTVPRRSSGGADSYTVRETLRLVPGVFTELDLTLPLYDGFLPIQLRVHAGDIRHERNIRISRPLRDAQIIVSLSRAPVFDRLQQVSAGQGGSLVVSYPFPERLPRHFAAYDAVPLVIFYDVPFDRLDARQRQALLGYVAAGGLLILGKGHHPDGLAAQLRSVLGREDAAERIRIMDRDEIVALVRGGGLELRDRMRIRAWAGDSAGPDDGPDHDLADRAADAGLLEGADRLLPVLLLAGSILGLALILYVPMSGQARAFLALSWLVLAAGLNVVLQSFIAYPDYPVAIVTERMHATSDARLAVLESNLILGRISSRDTQIGLGGETLVLTPDQGSMSITRDGGRQLVRDTSLRPWSLVQLSGVGAREVPVFASVSAETVALRNTRDAAAEVWYQEGGPDHALARVYLGTLAPMSVQRFSRSDTGAARSFPAAARVALGAHADSGMRTDSLVLVYDELRAPPVLPDGLRDLRAASVVILELESGTAREGEEAAQ